MKCLNQRLPLKLNCFCRDRLNGMMKFSRAISWVKWLSGEKSDVSKTISVLVLRALVWLRTRTEMVFETLVFLPLNHLIRPIARENFILLSRRESSKSQTEWYSALKKAVSVVEGQEGGRLQGNCISLCGIKVGSRFPLNVSSRYDMKRHNEIFNCSQ
jgi:hypothetical protein